MLFLNQSNQNKVELFLQNDATSIIIWRKEIFTIFESIMKSRIQSLLFSLLIFCSVNSFCQDNKINNPDADLQQAYYKKYKNEVRAYDRRKFDDLFFEYMDKQNNKDITLTKEEFYTYTIKIAIYSEKLGLLYKDKKDEAQKAKQDWFDKNYADYLNSKK